MSERQDVPHGKAAIIDAHERLMTAHREHDDAHRTAAREAYNATTHPGDTSPHSGKD